MSFNANFTWGAAAASYQIEGAAATDGKGPSVWDALCRQPNRIKNGHTGEIACDHYHRYAEDIALMAQLGLQAYRLSLSWPRILPNGTGPTNEAGLAFYDRLIDALLEAGIEPWVTLFHWDYPVALYNRGGWLNSASPDWFAEYTQVAVDRLSDRVAHWMTLNEPQCFIGLGHQTGEHAPGLRLGFADILTASHHALLAHGKSVQVIRARARKPPTVGYVPVGVTHMPATDEAADIEAAKKRMFSISGKHCWNNTWFADPVFLGTYPEDGLQRFAADLPPIGPDDMATIAQPLDFYGVNIYHGEVVRPTRGGGVQTVPYPAGGARTAMDWPVTPQALYWGPRFLYERYGLPLVVAENGMANCDWVQADGRVRDPQRIDYVRGYLQNFRRAAADGVDVRGYFLWSILDNFEWAEGYDKRFGIIHVDYETGQRTPKDSARWYSRVIASNGAVLDEETDVG
ncbi:MAG: beta-glucosidase [Candidatus Latescibacteria bacterium]|nr:beta-glucosidase [Candidatus Latescibacterota bacterium]